MSLTKAYVIKKTGEILLFGGDKYFIDVQNIDSYLSALRNGLLKYTGKDSIKEILDSGRGPAMVSVMPDKDIIIPNNLAKLTGYFYYIPDGKNLKQVQEILYGPLYNTPKNFWNWLMENYPEVLPIAEAYLDAGEEIGNIAKKASNIVAVFGAGVFMISLAILLSRNSNSSKAAYR